MRSKLFACSQQAISLHLTSPKLCLTRHCDRNAVSYADGALEEPTGRPVFYLTAFDASAQDVANNVSATLTVSEMQLPHGCQGVDPQACKGLCFQFGNHVSAPCPKKRPGAGPRCRTPCAPKCPSLVSCCQCRPQLVRKHPASFSPGTHRCEAGRFRTSFPCTNSMWCLCGFWTHLGVQKTSTRLSTMLRRPLSGSRTPSDKHPLLSCDAVSVFRLTGGLASCDAVLVAHTCLQNWPVA